MLNSENAIKGPTAGDNKLRTYRTFKNHNCTEPYVKVITTKRYRSAYAKFRCGVVPIKIETCRYGLNRVPVDQPVCETNVVEDEFHVIMLCSVIDDIRVQFMVSINEFNQDFKNLPLQELFTQIMSNPLYYKIVSKAMHSILNRETRKHVFRNYRLIFEMTSFNYFTFFVNCVFLNNFNRNKYIFLLNKN